MSVFDAHKDFAYSLIATAPSPASSGTTASVTAGQGSGFPSVPFTAVVCPAGSLPTNANAEKVRVTAMSGDSITAMTRAYDGSSARTIVVGDQIFAPLTATMLKAVEDVAQPNTVTTTSTGSQNDFAPGLVSGALNIVRCNNASDLTITGISATGIADGTRVRFVSVGAGNVYHKHQNASSAAANRQINIATSGDTPLAAGVGRDEFQYDGTTQRWRLIHHDQGGWIDFSSGASVSGWAATPTTHVSYKLVGSVVFVLFTISGTSNSANTSFSLPYSVALNSAVSLEGALGFTQDNTTAGASPGAYSLSGSTAFLYKDNTQGNWTATGTKQVRGNFTYQSS